MAPAPTATAVIADRMRCLSVPNLRGVVRRHAHIRVTGLDRTGAPYDQTCHGFTAGTMQHEIDHLRGRLFVDGVEDPTTFSTWGEFDRHHKDAFFARAEKLVEKYHR